MRLAYGPSPSFATKVRTSALAFAAALLLALAFAAIPQAAFAKSYSMPQVGISADVQADGTLNVQEQRTFDFDGSFTCVWWTFAGFPAQSEFQVNGVSLSGASYNNAKLEEVPFQSQWRSSGGPGRTCYSIDSSLHSVYVFFSVDDESLTVQLDYSVTNAVTVYGDVAELYWQYVGSQWEESSRNVDCTIALPMPEGAQAEPGENVYAWGHGPLDGLVEIQGDGVVTYDVPKVSAGEFAEARIAFPKDWMTGVAQSAMRTSDGLPTILSEEQQWADQANAQRNAARLMIAICILIGIAIIIWSLIMFLRHGKEYKVNFNEEYWRDVPDPNAQPAEIGRLWRWEAKSPDDFTATVMQLAHLGALKMEKGSYADARGRMVEDYCMVKVPEVADTITQESNPVGREVLDMLFEKFPAGASGLTASSQGHVWFGTINEYGKAHPQEFQDAMGRFQAALSVRVDDLHYFEAKGSILKMAMSSIGIACIAAGIFATVFMENFIPAIVGIVTGIVVLIIAQFMTRMTHRGAEVRAKAAALKRWLQDFSSLDERPPTDVKVWGEFMVYAYVFGIAEQVIRELSVKVPELFVAEPAGSAYVPWWFWYSPHYAHGMGGSLAGALSSTVTNTVSAATAALSSNSSGGGFGGGFSMGGGGGFGGGGGGAR